MLRTALAASPHLEDCMSTVGVGFGRLDATRLYARHPVLCHINCDFLLISDFANAARAVIGETERFLMVGRVHTAIGFRPDRLGAQPQCVGARDEPSPARAVHRLFSVFQRVVLETNS